MVANKAKNVCLTVYLYTLFYYHCILSLGLEKWRPSHSVRGIGPLMYKYCEMVDTNFWADTTDALKLLLCDITYLGAPHHSLCRDALCFSLHRMPHHINFPNTDMWLFASLLASELWPYNRGAQLSWVWEPVVKFQKFHWTQLTTNCTLSIHWLRKHVTTTGYYEFSNTFK